MLPACLNESQPPYQLRHSRLLARISRETGRKKPLSTERPERKDKTEGERGRERGDNEPRKRMREKGRRMYVKYENESEKWGICQTADEV